MALYSLLSLVIYLILLIFSVTLTSLNQINSYYQLILLCVYVSVFILSLTNPVKWEKKRFLVVILFAISASLYIGYSFFPYIFSFLRPTAYQFILPVEGQHNQLGDLGGLAFVALLGPPIGSVLFIPFALFILGILFVSFSKSAFLSMFGVLLILVFEKKGRYIAGALVFFILFLIIILLYTKGASIIPPIATAQYFMTKALHLDPKPLMSGRDSYFPQAIHAWATAPLSQFLFGYGPGNYVYASFRNATALYLTTTETHNIFLSIFIESGFLSLFWFILFCLFVIVAGFKNKNPSVYLFIYLLINFQTNFSYAIPLFMLLFFFFAGQCFDPFSSKMKNVNPSLAKTALVVTIGIGLFAGISYFFTQKEQTVLKAQLTTAITKQDKDTVENTIHKLEDITPYDEINLAKWSSIEEVFNNPRESARLLEKISVYSPRDYIGYFAYQLEFEKNIGVDLKKYLIGRKKDFSQFPYTLEERNIFNAICLRYAKIICIE